MATPVAAPSTDELLAQAAAAEHADLQTATQIVGEHAVTQEQNGYAAQLASQRPPQADVSPTPAQRSENLKTTASDVGHRIAEIPEGVYSGVVHAVGELGSAVTGMLAGGFVDHTWMFHYMADHATDPVIRQKAQEQVKANQAQVDAITNAPRGAADALTPKLDTAGGNITQGLTQFLTSFIPVTRALKANELATSGRVVANTLAGGLSQAAAFNPNDSRLSNLIQQYPSLKNPVTEFLASKPGDSEAEGRLKNLIEGSGLSLVSESAVEGVMGIFRGMRATSSIADNAKALADAKPTPVDHPAPQAPVVEPTAAEPAKPAYNVTHDVEEATGEHKLTTDKGELTASEGDSQIKVDRIDVAEEARGNGHGLAMMQKLHEVASERGKPLVSDVSVSPEQQRVYASLKKRGYDVQQNPGATTSETTGNLVSDHPNKPVFTIAPKVPHVESVSEVKPYEPPTLAKADTANPTGNVEQPKAAAPGATEQPKVFDPVGVARAAIQIPEGKSEALLAALKEGRYNEVPNMLDDTHRTIPWETLSDGANLKGLFNAVEDHFGAIIKSAHGTGPVSDKTIVQLAKDIGGDVNSVAKLFADTTSQGGLAARITAGYNIMTASARRLKDLGTVANSLNAETDAGKKAILDFEKQLQLHAAIVGQVRQSSSEIGRALYAHRSLKASSDVALANISDLAGTVLGPKAIKKFVASVGGTNNLAAINKAAAQLQGKGFAGVIKEIAQNGMLSGLPTQLANITGNASNMVIKVAERYLAGVIGHVRGVFLPDAETATIRSAVAHTAGAISGVRDSFPLMVKALVTEPTVSASGRPIARAIEMNTKGLQGADLTIAQVVNRVGQVVRYPGRLMGAIDNLNMGIGRQADLNSRVYTVAAGEADAKGLKASARDAFLDKRMTELRTDPPADVKEKSMEAGLYQSFQESARTRFGEGVSRLLNSHPIVKLLIAPFVHRPLNMLRQSLMDYTPMGIVSKTQRELLTAGGADMDVALARMTIGTGALAFAYEMASNGQTTGARLGSRNTESLDKIPRDSVRIGDRWYQYNRVDPVGLWLAIGADMHEHINEHYDPNNPDSTNDLATLTRMGVQVVGAAAMDKSFMKSTDQVMQALGSKDPKRSEVLMQQLIDSNVFKFVPFSGALRGAAQATDTTPRASGGDGLANIWDSVKANLPGLSKDLPPRRDILGRPLERPAGATAWWNPFGGSKASDDSMDQELSKVAVNVQTPPRQLENIVLDPHQYDEVIRRSTEAPIFPGGENLQGYMRQLTASEMWKSFETTDDHGVMARTKMVQQAVDAAYEYGKQDFMQSHGDFTNAMQARFEQQAKHYQRQ